LHQVGSRPAFVVKQYLVPNIRKHQSPTARHHQTTIVLLERLLHLGLGDMRTGPPSPRHCAALPSPVPDHGGGCFVGPNASSPHQSPPPMNLRASGARRLLPPAVAAMMYLLIYGPWVGFPFHGLCPPAIKALHRRRVLAAGIGPSPAGRECSAGLRYGPDSRTSWYLSPRNCIF